jgi:hypothetical protein
VFSVFGAALPVLVASGAIYYVLARVVVLPSGRGGYRVAAERVPGSTVLKVGI